MDHYDKDDELFAHVSDFSPKSDPSAHMVQHNEEFP